MQKIKKINNKKKNHLDLWIRESMSVYVYKFVQAGVSDVT